MKKPNPPDSAETRNAPVRAERVAAALPLTHGASRSETHNISATGVLFSTNEDATLGSTVSFSVEVVVDGQKMNLVCEGQVVRVDQKEGKVGVAAKVTGSFFEVI